MIYADYRYYKEQFHGVLIPEAEFEYNAARASEYIDWQTFDRITDKYMENESAAALKIKSCCCVLAEAEYSFSRRADISSEKNGSYSVTYSAKSSSDHSAEKSCIISRYLGNTGLLYRGVD